MTNKTDIKDNVEIDNPSQTAAKTGMPIKTQIRAGGIETSPGGSPE